MELCQKSRRELLSHRSTAESRFSYRKLFWIFMVGSILGFVLEGLWCILHTGVWEDHRATVWGPFCIVYGIGALVIYITAVMIENKPLVLQFISCMLSGSAVELAAGLFQNMCFGTSSWDYSHHPLNLAGQISLGQSLIWGALGVAFIRILLPWAEKLLRGMKGHGWDTLCGILSVYMAVNLLVSCAALERWQERHDGIAAHSRTDLYMDAHYSDARMAALFPNWSFLEQSP